MLETNNRHPKTSHNSRLIQRDGKTFRVKREGVRKMFRSDFYANSIGASWLNLTIGIVVLYLVVNAFFATLYWLDEGGIENARPGSFADAFFFSVQTLATIGYGKMAPTTLMANVLVAAEALTGLFGLAIATGLIFSKISRPKARTIFGNNALISDYKNLKCFIFRLGNLRTSQIADPLIKAVLICDEISEDGLKSRAFHDLKLLRNSVPLLMPSWTVRHHINEESPLFGMSAESLRKQNIEIIVSMVGYDETLSQTVHAHHSYIASEVKFGGKFVDIISWDKNDNISIDYKRFHDIKNA